MNIKSEAKLLFEVIILGTFFLLLWVGTISTDWIRDESKNPR